MAWKTKLIPGLLILSLLAVSTLIFPKQTFAIDSPLALDNVRVWYDATDSSTLFTDASCTTAVSSSNQTVKCWKDKSTYQDHAIEVPGNGAPTYQTNQFNGLSALKFNKSEDDTLRHVLDTPYTSNFTFFIVLKSTSENPIADESFFSNGNSPTTDHFQIDYSDATNSFRYRPMGINPLNFDNFNNSVRLYSVVHNGSTVATYSEGAGTDSGSSSDGRVFEQYRINQNRLGNTYHDSQIAEIIIYDKALSTCEREQVNSYLSKKYNNDFVGIKQQYDFGFPHKHDINGVGKWSSDCGGTIAVRTATSSIATISYPTSLDQNDYLTIAHNNLGFSLLPDAPSGFSHRLAQNWRVDKDNEPGNVTVSFDLSGTGIDVNSYTYALLIDNDTIFSNAQADTNGLEVTGNTVSFLSPAEFQNGQYFTLGLTPGSPPEEASWTTTKSVRMTIAIVSSYLDKIRIIAYPEKRVPRLDGNLANYTRVFIKPPATNSTLIQNSFTTGVLGFGDFIDISSLEIGIYDIFVKGTSHLTKKLPNVPLDLDTTEIDVSNSGTQFLLAGDINGTFFGDDIVNSIDLSILINDLDAFDLRSDLNRDDIVNALDLSVLITNLDKEGDV